MKTVERAAVTIAVAFLAMLYGFTAQRYELFPYRLLEPAYEAVTRLVLGERLTMQHYLHRAVYDRQGAHVLDAPKIQPGLTFISSHWEKWDWSPGMILVDQAGNVLHEWRADPAELWPESAATMLSENTYVHGSYLFPNGDVLFNFEYLGLLMIDACGEVRWRLDYPTHHAVTIDDEGNFWVAGYALYEHGNPEHRDYLKNYSGFRLVPGKRVGEDRILQVSPEGKVLRDIGLFEVLYRNELERYIPKMAERRFGDILHMNDVEVLSQKQAGSYPLFDAGDILVSLRLLHMVMVIDPDTLEVKWYGTDKWIEQHDPDFVGNGAIAVFDNNTNFGFNRGDMLGGSRIVQIWPDTGESVVRFPADEADYFYTARGGKLQKLGNGNLLITETQAGRVFEVTAGGDLVWEWINKPDAKNFVAEIMNGARYAITPEQVANWPCGPGG